MGSYRSPSLASLASLPYIAFGERLRSGEGSESSGALGVVRKHDVAEGGRGRLDA